jgi:hypothetical protein
MDELKRPSVEKETIVDAILMTRAMSGLLRASLRIAFSIPAGPVCSLSKGELSVSSVRGWTAMLCRRDVTLAQGRVIKAILISDVQAGFLVSRYLRPCTLQHV